MRSRGVTLIELLVAISIVGILAVAISRSYASGIDYIERSDASREREDVHAQFEDRLTELLSHACLSTDPTDTSSYFVAESSGSGGGGTLGGMSDVIVFNMRGLRLPGNFLASQDDFETLNQQYGPQGGTTEVQLSTTPLGDAGDKTGLFLREQRPADGDPTQGGLESLLNADVTSIGFEFYDGLEWQSTWDTQTMQTPRLPAAVRVTYTLEGDEESKQRTLVVRIPQSDVTSQNPVAQGGGTAR